MNFPLHLNLCQWKREVARQCCAVARVVLLQRKYVHRNCTLTLPLCHPEIENDEEHVLDFGIVNEPPRNNVFAFRISQFAFRCRYHIATRYEHIPIMRWNNWMRAVCWKTDDFGEFVAKTVRLCFIHQFAIHSCLWVSEMQIIASELSNSFRRCATTTNTTTPSGLLVLNRQYTRHTDVAVA